jgi:hypothetical protein
MDYVVILVVVLCIGLVKIVRSPLGEALGERLRGRSRGADAGSVLLAQIEALKGRLAEVEERLDFAERLLAQGREVDQLSGGTRS